MLISAVMPTTAKRWRWMLQAITCFHRQQGVSCELIIGGADLRVCMPRGLPIRVVELPDVDIGQKRNLINAHARGKYIAHWDDDDWYAPWRLASQLAAVQRQQTRISGHRSLMFWDAASDQFWRYRCPIEAPGACGSTLFYERSLWEAHPFDQQTSGEDWRWCSHHNQTVVDPIITTCIASTHAGNTSRRDYTPPWWALIEDYKPPIEAKSWLAAARLITQPVE